MRSISTGIVTELEGTEIRAFNLLHMNIDSVDYYYTDCEVPIYEAGNEYAPRGFTADTASYSIDRIVDQVSLEIDNLDETLTPAFVGGTPQGADVTLKKIFLNDAYQIVGGPGTVSPDLYYKYEEIDTGTIEDFGTLTKDLTIVNSPAVSTTNAKVGNALELNPLSSELLSDGGFETVTESTDQITDGDFETGAFGAGWADWGTTQTGDSRLVNTNNPINGTYSFELIRTGNGTNNWGKGTNVITVAQNQLWRAKVNYDLTSVTAGGVWVVLYDATNLAWITAQFLSTVGSGQVVINGFIPATCTQLRIGILASTSFNGTCYLDDVTLQQTTIGSGPNWDLWGAWQDGEVNWENTTNQRTGTNCLEVIQTTGANSLGRAQQYSGVTAGEKYSLLGYVNVSSITGGSAGLLVYDKTNSATIDFTTYTATTGGYNETVVDFYIPAGCTEIYVICWTSTNFVGTVYFDDVSLKQFPQNQYGQVSHDYGTVTKLSVSTWVYVESFNIKTSGSASRTPFVSDWNTFSVGSQKGFHLVAYNNVANGNQIQFVICDGVDYISHAYPIPADTDDAFRTAYQGKLLHVVGVFDGDAGVMKLWVDGVKYEKTSGVPTQCVAESATPIYVGRTTIDPGFLNGTIDETRIEFGAAWTDEEVQGLYVSAPGQNSITVFQGQVGEWLLDESKIKVTVTNQFAQWTQETISKHSPSCRWKVFKGAECQYAGTEPWCDRSYTRCQALGNTANFGGFRWLPSIEDKVIWWGTAPKE